MYTFISVIDKITIHQYYKLYFFSSSSKKDQNKEKLRRLISLQMAICSSEHEFKRERENEREKDKNDGNRWRKE